MKKLLLATLILFTAALPAIAQDGGETTLIPPIDATAVTPVIDEPWRATAGPCDVPPDQLPPECLPFTPFIVSPIPSPTSGVEVATEPPSYPPEDGSLVAPTETPTPTLVMNWPVHCYILIEVINPVLEPRLAEIWEIAQGLGQQVGSADETTQLRVRLDRRAALVESTFEPAELTSEALAARLSFELAEEITAEDLLLYPFACFSGYEASRTEALDYLWANLPQWQQEFRLS